MKTGGTEIHKYLSKIWNFIAFTLPYYVLRRLVFVAGKRREEIWNRLPFKNLGSPLILPDGNLLYCTWTDGIFWPRRIIEEIYNFQPYERFFKLRKNSVVVDVGAHIGIYTLRAAKKVGEKGLVIAVEPDDENYRILARNIRINRYKNVVPVKLALSDFEGKAKFYLKGSSIQHSLKEKIDIETHVLRVKEVTVMTLSGLLSKLHIANIDLLKVDVEGSELEVLRGAEELLAQHKISKIAIAAYHTSDEIRTIEEYLKELGYKVNIIKVTGLKYLHAIYPIS